MPPQPAPSRPFAQGSLTLALLLAAIGLYLTYTPPNPTTLPPLTSGDWIRRLGFVDTLFPSIAALPPMILTLHTALLSYFYPNIQPLLLRHGATNANNLNRDTITWSRATTIPLFCMLYVGIPLRLTAYSVLGRNFTFGLAEPDRLVTTEIYRYLQHPGYTGLVITVVSVAALVFRMDGVVSCWISPRWYGAGRRWEGLVMPLWMGMLVLMFVNRVPEEEAMMRSAFGEEWEVWHRETTRFIPWVF